MKKIFLMVLMMSGITYAMEMTNLSLDSQIFKKSQFINYLQKKVEEATCDEFDINACKNKCRGCLFRANLENRLAQAQGEHIILLRAQKRKAKS